MRGDQEGGRVQPAADRASAAEQPWAASADQAANKQATHTDGMLRMDSTH